eukprot:2367147-Karenia_brevis.AAC.1
MDGVSSKYQQVIEDNRLAVKDATHVNNVVTSSGEVSIDPSLFLSCSALCSYFAVAKPKALGESRIGGALFRAAPAAMSRIYHPLATKSVLSCCLPVSWVGGRVSELPKPGGSLVAPGGYREVVVADADSKPLLSHL